MKQATFNQSIEQLAHRIGPAARDPLRRHRQFPYRLEPGDGPDMAEAIRRDLDEILRGLDDMLWSQLRERFGSLSEADLDDLAQDIRVHLVLVSLPRFDATVGAKISTFAYKCISGCFRDFSRKLARQARKREKLEPFPDWPIADPSPPSYLDEKIHELALRILENPEQILTKAQAKVLQAVLSAGPGEQLKRDVSEAMGYHRPASMSMMLKRIRERIAQIDIEGWRPAHRRTNRSPETFKRRFGISLEEARRRRDEINRHLSARQAEVFDLILDHPTTSYSALARQLGQTPNNLNQCMYAIARRIAAIGQPPPPGRTRPPEACRPIIQKLGVDPASLSYALIERIRAVLSPRQRQLFDEALINPGLMTMQLAKRWGIASCSVSTVLTETRRKVQKLLLES